MNQELVFIYGMIKDIPFDREKLLRDFYGKVLETNRLLGLDPYEEEVVCEETVEKLLNQYHKLRVEECAEIAKALESRDRVEFLDGIVDTLVIVGFEYYLLTGATVSYDPSNMAFMDNVRYVIDSYEESFEDDGAKREARLFHLLQATQDILMELNVDQFEALFEVVDSNLSKFPTLDSVIAHHDGADNALELECASIESGGRYGKVEAQLIEAPDGTRVVFWANEEYGQEKRKYVKPFSFLEPDLSKPWRCSDIELCDLSKED